MCVVLRFTALQYVKAIAETLHPLMLLDPARR